MLKFLVFLFRLNADPSIMCPDFKQTNKQSIPFSYRHLVLPVLLPIQVADAEEAF